MATLGYTGDGNAVDNTNGFRLATPFVAGSSGTITSYHARMRFNAETDVLRIALFADDAGEPGDLIEEVTEEVATSGSLAWIDIPGTASIVNGQTYHLAVGCNASGSEFRVAYNDASGTIFFQDGTGAMADPFGAPDGSFTGQISCYATYTEAGGSAAVTGTLTANANEGDVRAGGKTIVITLSGDTWAPA